MSREIYVFADWEEFTKPMFVGTLRSDVVKAKEHFSFAYDKVWLQSKFVQQIDPELQLYAGEQHNNEQQNFRVFLDSCPDRWGRLLMKRREAVIARQEERKRNVLNESDYLLGVHDRYRMGALRFKLDFNGDFLDNKELLAAPPITSLRELEHAVSKLEEAYDINPVATASGLHLNINDDDNSLNYELAMEVIDLFQLSKMTAKQIHSEVLGSVANWESVATKVGIGRAEQQLMAPAFNI